MNSTLKRPDMTDEDGILVNIIQQDINTRTQIKKMFIKRPRQRRYFHKTVKIVIIIHAILIFFN